MGFVVVAGAIASGKSTVASILSERLCLPWLREEPEDNPFLHRFYADPKRWALASQMHFLLEAHRQHPKRDANGSAGIQDHSFDGCHEVYNVSLLEDGALTRDEFRLLEHLYRTLETGLRPPDVVVLLHAEPEVLLDRVRRRGRDYEAGITEPYLARLSVAAERFYGGWTRSPVVRVNTGEHDLLDETEQGWLTERIARAMERSDA